MVKRKRAISKNTLNHQQLKFANYYLGECSFNGVQSAKKAGYKGNYNTLCATASRLLRNVKVSKYLEKEFAKVAMPSTEVIARLSDHARGSLADILNKDGEFDLSDARLRGKDHLLKKLKITRNIVKNKKGPDYETINYEYEVHDKLAALEKLGKVHSLFTDKIDHSGQIGIVIEDESE